MLPCSPNVWSSTSEQKRKNGRRGWGRESICHITLFVKLRLSAYWILHINIFFFAWRDHPHANFNFLVFSGFRFHSQQMAKISSKKWTQILGHFNWRVSEWPPQFCSSDVHTPMFRPPHPQRISKIDIGKISRISFFSSKSRFLSKLLFLGKFNGRVAEWPDQFSSFSPFVALKDPHTPKESPWIPSLRKIVFLALRNDGFQGDSLGVRGSFRATDGLNDKNWSGHSETRPLNYSYPYLGTY